MATRAGSGTRLGRARAADNHARRRAAVSGQAHADAPGARSVGFGPRPRIREGPPLATTGHRGGCFRGARARLAGRARRHDGLPWCVFVPNREPIGSTVRRRFRADTRRRWRPERTSVRRFDWRAPVVCAGSSADDAGGALANRRVERLARSAGRWARDEPRQRASFGRRTCAGRDADSGAACCRARARGVRCAACRISRGASTISCCRTTRRERRSER